MGKFEYMNRLTDNDKNYGPLTVGRWSRTLSAYIEGGGEDDAHSRLLIVAFGLACRLKLPFRINPLGKYGEHARRYGFSLSDMGNGYDFFQCFFGPQTHDSLTTKSWSRHLPWKQWDHVRHSIYTPTGELFYTKLKGANFGEFFANKDQCPKAHFGFEDSDGELIIATCTIEEREWHKGSGLFTWLRLFYSPKVRRSLDLSFSAEVGPEKGSWKGGTTGHGIDMLQAETPRHAFERYCANEHNARYGRKYRLRFIGPCGAPMLDKAKSQ